MHTSAIRKGLMMTDDRIEAAWECDLCRGYGLTNQGHNCVRCGGSGVMAATPAKVGVKPLEWAHRPDLDIWSAASNTYWVWERNGIGYWRRWWPNNDGKTDAVVADGGLESAKAAAQADYEARIRGTLTFPASAERDAELVGELAESQRVLTDISEGYRARAEAAEAEASRLRTENEKLREALTPFAEMASDYDPEEGDDADLAWFEHPKVGDLRRARAALESKDE